MRPLMYNGEQRRSGISVSTFTCLTLLEFVRCHSLHEIRFRCWTADLDSRIHFQQLRGLLCHKQKSFELAAATAAL